MTAVNKKHARQMMGEAETLLDKLTAILGRLSAISEEETGRLREVPYYRRFTVAYEADEEDVIRLEELATAMEYAVNDMTDVVECFDQIFS